MRVSAERVFELARHLTERDREIVMCVYDQQVLTTGQLALLFFSSIRRAQDRLLFLYRERVLDRFYPPSRFGAGKPQAHWLLDEAGALLVAATLGVERKKLGWQRREDWASHPQLAHRLESNRFVTDLIAATLAHPAVGVSGWYSSRDACARLGPAELRVRPDACFIVDTRAGGIECYLEWDRGTEPSATLTDKLEGYRLAEGKMHYTDEQGPRNVLFVVPGSGRITTLRRCYDAFAPTREWSRESVYRVNLDGDWPLLAATATDLNEQGPLAPVWESITDLTAPARTLTDLPVRADLGRADLALALGRRWRHTQPDFWERLSPLGRAAAAAKPREVEDVDEWPSDCAQPRGADVAQPRGAATDTDQAEMRHPAGDKGLLARRRAELEEELRADIAAARARRRGPAVADLRPSEIAGYMDEPEPDEEGSWQ